MYRVFLLASTLVAAVVAGCVGDAGEPRIEPQFDSETGSIVGMVVNEAELPVAGVNVGILDPPITTVTNEVGVFSLNRVPPGEHQVHASAFGYEPTVLRVTAHAGRATDGIVLALQPMPSDDPYHIIDAQRVQLSGVMWKLTPECIYTDIDPLVKTCGGVRAGNSPATTDCVECETHYGIDHITYEWRTIVAEMAWTPQTGFTGRGFNFDVSAPNIERGTGGSINQADPKTWVVNTDQVPIQIRIDNPETMMERGIPEQDWYPYPDNDCEAPGGNNCDWFFRVFPAYCDLGNCHDGFGPDYGIMLESVGEVYFTVFVREPAPAEWSGLPEA